MIRYSRIITALAVLLSASTSFAQAVEQIRVGAISLEYVATHSETGKAALAAIDAFGRKKSLEVESKAAELQKQQVELQQQSPTMSPRAVADLRTRSTKDLERACCAD